MKFVGKRGTLIDYDQTPNPLYDDGQQIFCTDPNETIYYIQVLKIKDEQSLLFALKNDVLLQWHDLSIFKIREIIENGNIF